MNTTNQAVAATKAARELAAATKKICAGNGRGNQVVIWADYSWSEATGPNDTIAKATNEGIEYPIARFTRPMSAKEVRNALV